MRTHCLEHVAPTARGLDFVDITPRVQAALDESGIRDGHVLVFVPENDCTIIVNELESGLLQDIGAAADRISTATAGATLGSTSVVVPAVDGTLRLGTWQRILLVELDGGGERRVLVQVSGE